MITSDRQDDGPADRDQAASLQMIQDAVDHASHLLPTQGPISVFVHHNTLHAFEHLSFDQAVLKGLEVLHGQPYLSEDRYRSELHQGRINSDDVSTVLLTDLGDAGDELLGFFGTRYHLRLAMLEHPLQLGTDAELKWFIAETDALDRFRSECAATTRQKMVSSVQQLANELASARPSKSTKHLLSEEFLSIAKDRDRGRWTSWNASTWESVTLRLMWAICHKRVPHAISKRKHPASPLPTRHRDYLLRATGVDLDSEIHPLLISFTSAFVDQGLAPWALPDRESGFFQSFISQYSSAATVCEPWRRSLAMFLRNLHDSGATALESIADSLAHLGVQASETETYIAETLDALRGWAGMLWQLETTASWTVRPAPQGSLIEFLAVRLILERVALQHFISTTELNEKVSDLRHLRSELKPFVVSAEPVSTLQYTFLIFQLGQLLGWMPEDLASMKSHDWQVLIDEMDAFSSLQRRRIYHLAYEAHYRRAALDALTVHAKAKSTAKADTASERSNKTSPAFQVVCCIDDREESFRRHLEEVAPQCETFGVAGFFAIAMYYRGVAEAHFRPLCPAVIRPQHYVTEEVSYSLESSHRTRARHRHRLGTVSHRFHLGSRSIFAGMVTSLAGSFAAAPMVGRILFPRFTAQVKRLAGSVMRPPASTRLVLERLEEKPGDAPGHQGYSIDEMAAIVKRILEDMGVVDRLARLVIFIGHGSTSLNNPHESAYNCGACSGAKGGPNARGFAQMANDHRVRQKLAASGVLIPADTYFIGALHNTCDDDVEYFDLDQVPVPHRADFERARDAIEAARGRNALERCRRFESAANVRTVEEALRHVETRSEDLSQARPEYNHATSAMLIVGRRENTRGLFLDRRAFLVAYDPSCDTTEQEVLARILAAAIPVCAGISLEYYFSTVDTAQYGCGSKLPHNITALVGVMEGAASDLRTGLSAQMVEIHEPMRILTVIETTREAMLRIMSANSTIAQLVSNGWIQLALLDPESKDITYYTEGKFVPHQPQTRVLPTAASSLEWHRNQREHLGFAVIDSAALSATASKGNGS